MAFESNKKFFSKEFEVTIIIEGNFNTFDDFKSVFHFFDELDKTYQDYKYKNEYQRRIREKTEIVSISQGSLEIVAFVEQHWLEILLLFMANYRDIKLNTAEAHRDIDNLVYHIQETFSEITRDFPEFERQQFIDLINWFDTLTIEQRHSFIRKIKRGRKILERIRRIARRR